MPREAQCMQYTGHGGHEAVDYAVESLAPAVERILKAALIAAEGNNLPYATISKILVQAISEIDDAITCGIKELFPGGPEEIAKMSDNEIDAIVNDFETGGLNNAKVLKGMRGSTVLISLVDPAQQNLWVASLGDCQAGNVIILNIGVYEFNLYFSTDSTRHQRLY